MTTGAWSSQTLSMVSARWPRACVYVVTTNLLRHCIDFTASQTQPSAERACSLREAILVHTDQGCGVVRHDGHPRLHNGAVMAFVREVCGATAPQAGNDAFDHRSAVPTGAGEIYLGRRPYAVQLGLVQDSEDIVRRGRRGEGIDGFRDPHGENPLCVQRLTQGHVIEREIARERVDGRGGVHPTFESSR